jgi:hypothetical protein
LQDIRFFYNPLAAILHTYIRTKLIHQHNTKFMKKIIFQLILILAVSGLTVKRADAQVLSVGVSIHIGPPVIPVYTQPVCPVDGYLWVPGYWAYDDDYGYFWVPGYWAEPPEIGFLWTPGYWGYVNGIYAWNGGYWGPHIGFYGGVNYGCGYFGAGYAGGGWVGGHFRYNTAVTNVNTTIVHNTYIDRTVVNNSTTNRVSYNGGPGGINARPTPEQESAAHDRHVQATATQMSHQHNASIDRSQFASVNHGRPANMAVARPTAYHPVNSTASLARATATGRTGNAANHNPAPATTHAPAVHHNATPPVHQNAVAPVHHNPAPPANHPQPQAHPMSRPAPSRPQPQEHAMSRPAPSRPQPQSRPVSHPQPVHQAPPRPAPAPHPAPRQPERQPEHHR